MFEKSLPELKIGAGQGRKMHGLSHLQHIILIDQSITGLYEKRTKLWPDSEQL